MGAYRMRPRRPVDNSVIPSVIFALLIANGLVFAAQNLMPGLAYFALWPLNDQPAAPDFMPWQLLTYGFLHGDTMHLLVNMFGLWMFGSDLERVWGPRRFAAYYLVCVIGAGVVQLLVAAWQGGIYPTVGASGGVFGILLAFGMTYPNRQVMLLFPPIPMPAKFLVIGYGALELFYGVTGRAPGIAHFAHLGGMLFGFLLLRYWQRRR